MALVGCANMTLEQKHAIATSAITFAQIAVSAAATFYGGPAAGQLARSGLDGLAAVVQDYVGSTIPPAVVAASPGIKGVGPAVAPLISPDHIITEADAIKVEQAAAIAPTLKP